ncbi:hypothetical protein GCM10011351_29390 [Paraliobacillus quinghaiensis]|uniref:Uncharacterized protein n=1 Tax=Paraliobacillus quinghaiensis TaxID=470815 RepID=A0A917WYJ0_9BACI|nr:hypothetical protein [Paraliobacillus quinghaiensis]GGM41342.1 hypothetical protein GCM10011351_29390 [Paraliobacillus quinghaiensis]
MPKIKSLFVVLLLSFILIGCQNNNLNLSEDVSSIEVYEWSSEELMATIDDKEFINELVKELDNAKTGTTSNMDFESPDFRLHFKSGNETLFEMGYYKKVINLDVEGRYWDFSEDIMYNSELQLPFE